MGKDIVPLAGVVMGNVPLAGMVKINSIQCSLIRNMRSTERIRMDKITAGDARKTFAREQQF